MISWLTDEMMCRTIMEDLEYRFVRYKKDKGLLTAIIHHVFQCMLIIIPLLFEVVFGGLAMLKNYLKIALRTILHQKGYSLINISSLAAGIACCILIFFYVQDENTYDKFHSKIDRIHYLYSFVDIGFAKLGDSPNSSLAQKMVDDFPEVENAVRLKKDDLILKKDNHSIKLSGISADPSFFDIFSFPLVLGNSEDALNSKFNIVLTSKTSHYFFGEENPVGETVALKIKEEFVDFIVSGVTQQIPYNSSLQFDFLINIHSVHAKALEGEGTSVPTFILLSDKKYKSRLLDKFPETIDKDLGKGFEKYNPKGQYHLHALADFHTSHESASGILSNRGNITYTYILSGIALLILFIACFNYTNLSVACISNRIKEVGLRKVLGAQRRQIAKQFMFESFVICVFSMGFGLLVAVVGMPIFNSLVYKNLTVNLFNNGLPVLFLLFLTIFVGCVAGSYPSLVVSRFSSIELFQGRIKMSGKNILSRALIVIQFSISIFLIIATLFIYKQNNFMIAKDLGYDCDKVVRIQLENISEDVDINRSFYANYKNSIVRYSAIKYISGATNSLSSDWFHLFGFELKKTKEQFDFNQNQIDYDYIDLLGISIVEGRNFSAGYPSDIENGIIVNEEFVKESGISEPVGRTFGEFFTSTKFDNYQIIAVVKDFHYESLSEKILPIVLKINKDELYKYVYVKFSGRIKETLEILKKEYKNLAPNIPFEYYFVYEQVALQYQKEEKWSRITTIASLFAITIACSGLFALTLLVVKKRTKEIGIRKVLGASAQNITKLIIKEFIWLIGVANIIAWPIVYYCINLYLQNYSYRVSIELWIFAAAGLLTMCIAVLTIGVQALKATLANPIHSLRYE